MSDKILHKRSLTSGSIPSTESLEYGELAINVADGAIYLKKSGSAGDTIESAVITNSTSSGDITIDGTITATTIETDIFSANSDTLIVTGSILVDGQIQTIGITGSLQGTAQTASYVEWNNVDNKPTLVSQSVFNEYTQSTDLRLQSLETESGSIRNEFNSYTGSNDTINTTQNNRLDLLSNESGSIRTTLNTYTSSTDLRVQSLEIESSSVRGRLENIESFSSSQLVLNPTFATTGSNTFSGSQNIIGSVTSSKVLTDSIVFRTGAGVSVGVGELAWNNSDGTLDLGMKGGNVVQQIGQEIFYEVRNATGDVIKNGTALYASGVTVGSGRIEAAPLAADGSIREIRFLGLATEDISNGVNGFVTHFGYVRGLDTRGTAETAISVGDETWAVGDILYVHPTVAGKLTNIPPKHKIYAAIVINRNQNAGVLFVRPTSYGHIDDIHDVAINTGSLSTGDLLVYDANTDDWKNTKTLSGSYQIHSGNLIVDGGITGSIAATNGVVSSSSQIIEILEPLNSYTSSNDLRLGSLELESGSIRDEFNSYTSSNDTLNTTQNNRLDLLSTESGSIRSELNSYTSSTNLRLGSLELESGSIRTDFNLYTQSNDTVNTTQNSRLDGLSTESGSIRTELNSYTSSQNTLNQTFATTGSNVFVGNQTIYGDIVVTGDLTAKNFYIDSASVIYTSGSTKFGDTVDDVHEFTGSVEISGSISLNGEPIGTGKLDESLFNLYTGSTNIRLDNLESFTSSINTTIKTQLDVNTVVSSSTQIRTLTYYREDVSGNSSYTVTHNLNELYPIVQVYESGTNEQVIPLKIKSNSVNEILVEFTDTFAGSIIVKS